VRKGYSGLLIVLILTCFSLIWLLTRVYLTTKMHQAHASTPTAILQEGPTPLANVQTPDAATLLAAEAILLDRLEADLDGDGRSEIVLIFNSRDNPYGPGAGGMMIVAPDGDEYRKIWETHPSSEGQVAGAVIRDINLDGILEALFFKSTEDRARHFLYIFAWDGTEYTSLRPDGGTLAGEEAFISAYYPPEVQNVDSTNLDEIVVFEDNASSERLEAMVYRWNGKVYTYVDYHIGAPSPFC
jgi:hypothetical protein